MSNLAAQYSIPGASLLPTVTLAPSESSALNSLIASATSADPSLASYIANANLSTLDYDAVAYSLNQSQTGCLRIGALPVALAMNDTCLPGFLCENSNNQSPPQYCPPTEPCQIRRMGRDSCGQAQGVLEPLVCSAGRYCPFDNATMRYGKESIVCPAGFFCPTGSYEPWKCLYGASCPEGSPRQLNTLPLWVVIGIDVILGIIVAVGFAISKWRKSRPKKYTTLEGENGHGDDVELLGAQAMPAKSPRLSVSAPGSHTAPVPLRLVSAHNRRMSGRADYWDGGYDDPETNIYDADPLEEDYHNSPDFQRFLRSMAKTIETNSIGLSFDFENLSFETKGKKILQEVTGTMPRGSCWGVMGGSGAGKSTFLNALMGKIKISGGNIMINGWKKDMSKYKKLIGYVPQDDIVFPELTVRENILHSGRIRLPASWRDKQIQDHVDALIACLQLTHVQHSRVGDASKPIISGGQRKRVNIGMELAAAPMAIFLDEPTSGLDSSSAATIMRLLRALSRLGMTVISIIHQPREQIFYGFDQLLLLSQGRSVYSGPTDEMQNYFETLGFAFPQRANPADTLMDIITGEGAQYTTGAGKMETDVKSLIDEWRARGQYQIHNRHLSVGSDLKSQRRRSNQSMNSTVQQEDNLVRTMKARGASWPAQIFYCWKRAMTQQVRKATSFFFEIGVGGLAGVVIGLSAFASNGHLFQGVYQPPFTELSSAVDYNSTPQVGLLGAMAIGLAASAPGFWVFGEEKLMYFRETGSGHSRSAYYLGKLLSTLLRIALSSLHFSVFLGVLATPLISFPRMYIANLLYFWNIYGLASVVSMLVKREDGPLISVLASLIIGVLGGVAPPLSKVKTWRMEWLWRTSPGVWFTEAYFTENLTPLGYLYNLELASMSVGFTLNQFVLDMIMLFVIGVVYRLLAYLALITVHRDKQR